MRTVMLGFTGAGKTTYMASLYGAFSKANGNRLLLRTVDEKAGKHLNELANAIASGRYPDFTNQRSEYLFHLQSGHHAVEFSWSDYRGGAIAGSQNERDVAALLHEVSSADGIMIFADAQELSSPLAHKVKLGMLVQLLGRAVEATTRKLAVSVLLTKFDAVRSPSAQMLRPLEGFIGAVEASSKIDAALIPVACGRAPLNVTQPLFFSLHHSLNHEAAAWHEIHTRREAEARQLEQRARNQGFFSDMFEAALKVVFDEPTTHDLANASRAQAQSDLVNLTTFQTIRSAVDRELKQVCRIRRGRTPEDYWREILSSANRSAATRTGTSASPFDWH